MNVDDHSDMRRTLHLSGGIAVYGESSIMLIVLCVFEGQIIKYCQLPEDLFAGSRQRSERPTSAPYTHLKIFISKSYKC